MNKVIHITLIDQPGGRVEVLTNDQEPAIGRLLTPAEAISIDLLRVCRSRANAVRFGPGEAAGIEFARRLLSPEDLGHAVTPEVRDLAREVLGLPRTETRPGSRGIPPLMA